jgi:hypothetical protein
MLFGLAWAILNGSFRRIWRERCFDDALYAATICQYTLARGDIVIDWETGVATGTHFSGLPFRLEPVNWAKSPTGPFRLSIDGGEPTIVPDPVGEMLARARSWRTM